MDLHGKAGQGGFIARPNKGPATVQNRMVGPLFCQIARLARRGIPSAQRRQVLHLYHGLRAHAQLCCRVYMVIVLMQRALHLR